MFCIAQSRWGERGHSMVRMGTLRASLVLPVSDIPRLSDELLYGRKVGPRGCSIVVGIVFEAFHW